MHPFLDYILKANLLLIFFGLFYLIFLKRETFYQLNRWYFIGSIIASISAPLVTFTKTVLVEPIPVEYFVNDNETVFINEVVKEPSFLETIDLQQVAVYLILLISSILIIRKIYAVAKLYRSIKKLPSLDASNIKTTADTKTVYSFYQWIVVPENFFQWQNHKIILDHESIHLNQKHTFDLILIELVAAVFWFNPLVKVMQRAINTNLEFIVDQKMIETTESVLYQKNLLQFQTQHAIQFVNSYNASEIKNRILQLNSKKSTNMKKLKFLLATPALVAFFALFQIETVAQVKETIEVQEVFENDEVEDSFYVMIHSQYDDAYYEKTVKMLREKYNLNVTIENLKRNKDGELTSIKISCKDDNQYFLNEHKTNTKPFSPFKLYVYKKDNGKYYIETVSEKNTKEKLAAVSESDFFMLLDTVEKDLDVLKNDRKTFDLVASKFPIVIDGVLMNKKELKNFDTSRIKSVHIDAGNPEKGTIVNLSTNDDDNSGSRIFTFKIADDNVKSDFYLKENLKPNLIGAEKPYYKIMIDGKEATEEELQKFYRTAKTFQARNENKVLIVETNIAETNIDKPHTTIKIGNKTLKYIYLLNGKEISGDDFGKIHPDDVERIDVLKDKKVIEKYGDKAKDGVLLITTKAKKEVSLQRKTQALKARELAVEKRNEVVANKKRISQHKQIVKKQREKLLAKRKETIIVSNKNSDKKQLEDDYKTLNNIFNDLNKTVKEIEDDNIKITSVKASLTREDGTKVELSEVY